MNTTYYTSPASSTNAQTKQPVQGPKREHRKMNEQIKERPHFHKKLKIQDPENTVKAREAEK